MYKKKKRGQSMVEFAMLAPFIFLVLATIIEGSPMINAYAKVEKATETGARIAAVYGQTDNDVLNGMLRDLYQMTNRENFANFNPPSDDNGGISSVSFGTNCDAALSNEKYLDYATEPLDVDGGKLCFSEAREPTPYSAAPKTTIRIYPTLRYRINGSWTTVTMLYHYRVYTPILFFMADILSATESPENIPPGVAYYKFVPIYKYSTKKVE